MGACYCRGPQNGEPRCPCQMRARERLKDELREEILRELRPRENGIERAKRVRDIIERPWKLKQPFTR